MHTYNLAAAQFENGPFQVDNFFRIICIYVFSCTVAQEYDVVLWCVLCKKGRWLRSAYHMAPSGVLGGSLRT